MAKLASDYFGVLKKLNKEVKLEKPKAASFTKEDLEKIVLEVHQSSVFHGRVNFTEEDKAKFQEAVSIKVAAKKKSLGLVVDDEPTTKETVDPFFVTLKAKVFPEGRKGKNPFPAKFAEWLKANPNGTMEAFGEYAIKNKAKLFPAK